MCPHLFSALRSLGRPCEEWKATATAEAQASAELYCAISEGRFPHDHDQLLVAHVARLQIHYAADGSTRLVRPADGEPADAALAIRNAGWRAPAGRRDPGDPIRIY